MSSDNFIIVLQIIMCLSILGIIILGSWIQIHLFDDIYDFLSEEEIAQQERRHKIILIACVVLVISLTLSSALFFYLKDFWFGSVFVVIGVIWSLILECRKEV